MLFYWILQLVHPDLVAFNFPYPNKFVCFFLKRLFVVKLGLTILGNVNWKTTSGNEALECFFHWDAGIIRIPTCKPQAGFYDTVKFLQEMFASFSPTKISDVLPEPFLS